METALKPNMLFIRQIVNMAKDKTQADVCGHQMNIDITIKSSAGSRMVSGRCKVVKCVQTQADGSVKIKNLV